MRIIEVTQKDLLLDYILKNLTEYKRTHLKQLLKYGHISVNGQLTTKFNFPLEAGDQIAVEPKKRPTFNLLQKFKIEPVYEDDDLIVINKPAELLSIATEKVKTKTAYHLVNEYVKNKSAEQNSRIFVVHRLDQETSGLLVFAKTAYAKRQLQNGWDHVRKRYFAVVCGKPPQAAGEIKTRLMQNKFLHVYSTSGEKGSYFSVTKYRLIKSTKRYSLLDIELETGRKHQIRVHLADLGIPVVGESRYAEKNNERGGLALHAYSLVFRHPTKRKILTFRTKLPDRLAKLIDQDK